jgi:hypothetical protein
MRRWAVAGALFLLAAAALLWLVEDEPSPPRAAVEFPRAPRPAEVRRMEERRSLPVPLAATAPGEGGGSPRRDPLLLALPATAADPVVVFEANALRHSRLGELFVACVLSRDADAFAELERESGIDVLKDVDRVAFAGDAMVVSGHFDRARWDALAAQGLVPARYGDDATIWAVPASAERPPDTVVATWRDQLVVVAQDEARARRAIDQVEGRLEPEATLPDELAYGEVYGLVPGDALRRLGGVGGADDLPSRIAAAASRVEIHVDAMRDVAAVVRVRGEDAARLDDLSRALGGAIAAARLEAMATRDERLASLLDAARVALEGERAFSLEVALPADRLEEWFSRCGAAPAR